MKACRNPSPRPRTRARGFTILELMITIGLAALILGLGVPSFQGFIRNSRMTGVANDFLAAVYMARTEAVKRRATVVLCLSTNPMDPDSPDCDGDGTQGWVAFVDDADPNVVGANDLNGVRDAGEEILLQHEGLHETVQTAVRPAGAGVYVAFSPGGMLRELAAIGDPPLRAFVMCDDRGNVVVSGDDISAARAVLVSPIGRPRVTRSTAEIESDDVGGCP